MEAISLVLRNRFQEGHIDTSIITAGVQEFTMMLDFLEYRKKCHCHLTTEYTKPGLAAANFYKATIKMMRNPDASRKRLTKALPLDQFVVLEDKLFSLLSPKQATAAEADCFATVACLYNVLYKDKNRALIALKDRAADRYAKTVTGWDVGMVEMFRCGDQHGLRTEFDRIRREELKHIDHLSRSFEQCFLQWTNEKDASSENQEAQWYRDAIDCLEHLSYAIIQLNKFISKWDNKNEFTELYSPDFSNWKCHLRQDLKDQVNKNVKDLAKLLAKEEKDREGNKPTTVVTKTPKQPVFMKVKRQQESSQNIDSGTGQLHQSKTIEQSNFVRCL